MSSQHTDHNDATRRDLAEGTQAAPGAGPAGGPGSGEAGGRGDAHGITQAARSVMHPERHDPEWRYYHGAAVGG